MSAFVNCVYQKNVPSRKKDTSNYRRVIARFVGRGGGSSARNRAEKRGEIRQNEKRVKNLEKI